jgi:hypothetical protein
LDHHKKRVQKLNRLQNKMIDIEVSVLDQQIVAERNGKRIYTGLKVDDSIHEKKTKKFFVNPISW